MKVNFKKFPFMKIIEDGDINLFTHRLKKPEEWSRLISALLSKYHVEGIEYQTFSIPFIEKAWEKGKDIIRFFKIMKPCNGCLLQDNGLGYFYEINPLKNQVQMFVIKDNIIAGVSRADIIVNKALYKEGFGVRDQTDERLVISYHKEIWSILLINLLKQFAEVQVKYIGGDLGVKNCKLNGAKFISEINISVSHYDCSWFTECISDKDYGVRAYIRIKNGKFEFVRAHLRHGRHSVPKMYSLN
jgi:hypothetical protein